MKILYIDDHQLLTESVKRVLGTTYTVDTAHTGRDGIALAGSIHYSLILLDLGLPDMNGLDVCRELRAMKICAPILVLSVKKDIITSVEMLNSGADDYITKPFNSDNLKARVAALLRRGSDMHDEKVVDVGDLKVNITKRQVWRDGVKISLSRKEFDILEYLITNHGRTLTRSMILDHVWESGTEGWNNTVDVHIKNLRDKVDRPFGRPLIKTAYGVGYLVDDSL